MKKTAAAIIFICSFTILRAQNFELNAGPIIGFENQNLKSNIGVELGFEYLTKYHISLRSTIGRYKTKLKKGSPYYNQINFMNSWFEESILILPLGGVFQPYVGAGFGYYVLDRQAYSPTLSNEDYSILTEKLDNKLALNLSAGLKMFFNERFGFLVDGKYVFLKSESSEVLLKYTDTTRLDLNENLKLNTFFFKMGIIIKL